MKLKYITINNLLLSHFTQRASSLLVSNDCNRLREHILKFRLLLIFRIVIMYFTIHIYHSTTCNTSCFTFRFIIRRAHPVRFSLSFFRDCKIMIINDYFWIFCTNIKVDYICKEILQSIHKLFFASKQL